jgi:hypothetical protein
VAELKNPQKLFQQKISRTAYDVLKARMSPTTTITGNSGQDNIDH